MEGPGYDLLLKHAQVLCMDAALTHYPDAFVAVKGADIAALGPLSVLPAGASAAAEIDCAGCVVMPGLINAHTHLPMVYFRGMADDLPLTTWLEQHIWPAEAKYLNPDFVYEATLLAAAECLKGGVTCVNDMYLFAFDVARACADAGLRAFVGEGVIDLPTPSAPTWRDGVRLARELIAAYAEHPLITPTVCAHAPYTCSEDLLQTLHGLAKQHGLLFHTHLSETFDEADRIAWARDAESSAHALLRLGVLGPRMIAAHCVWVDDHDLHHMQECGCAVAHCPTSNLKLGSGIAPVHSMIEAGVAVGLGTDGAASNNNLNLWEEVHLAALLAKGVYKNAEVVSAPVALSFATAQGAAALGAAHTGTLAPGKRADIIVVELDALHLTPRYPGPAGVMKHLVYSAQMSGVRDTIVHGQVLMRERQLTRLNEAELKAKAQAWVEANW
jgi:5-methylthioadenosine/S-adenosylhomocysteine deaminase